MLTYTPFEEYCDRYKTIKMRREGGVLELTFHTDGGPLQWSAGGSHTEFSAAFSDIARDDENEVVIMTGTGDAFSGPVGDPNSVLKMTPRQWENIRRHGMQLTNSLLNMDAIVISCVNGPAVRHPEIPLSADIVLAADTATFQDSAHFRNGMVPGDGIHFIFPALLGPNRARYFTLTGETIAAEEAKRLGMVAELMPADQLLPRAWELAEEMMKQSLLVRRYTKMAMIEPLRRAAQDWLGYGLALEGLAVVDGGEDQ